MKYLKQAIHTGYMCPVCGEENSGESMGATVIEYSLAHLDMSCLECEAEWTETFKLHSIKLNKEGTCQVDSHTAT
jgi:transcription elongation factor Elf1